MLRLGRATTRACKPRHNRTAFLALFIFALVPLPQSAYAQTLDQVVKESKLLLNVRTRFEDVHDERFAEDAQGLILRARVGVESGSYEGFRALVEGEFTRALEPNNFNSTVNGRTQYATIADPNSNRLNRLQLSYSGLPDTNITVGRQRIILREARFVGNVGWRLNEQTYDAIRLTNSSIDGIDIDYTYLWQVNRIFGSKSPADKFDADTHLINVAYALRNIGTLTGYAYLIDLKDSPANSNKTFGLRFTGDTDIADGYRVSYGAEYASQRDYANNPADFHLDYWMARGGLAYGDLSARVMYESLEGNGTRGFATPLATLHAFQGYADDFLTTPANGIKDLQVSAGYVVRELGKLGDVKLQGWFHDFTAQRGSEDLGEEVDLLAGFGPWKGFALAFKYANHFGAPNLPHVSKFWIMLTYAY